MGPWIPGRRYPSLVSSIYSYVRKKGFVFSRELLANLFSLKTKPFVILAVFLGREKQNSLNYLPKQWVRQVIMGALNLSCAARLE